MQHHPAQDEDPAAVERGIGGAFLDAQEPVQRFREDIRAFLAHWLPEVERDNRSYLTVAVGCTGGRHRSVYLVERLAESFRGRWNVLVRHRGLDARASAA